MNFERTRWYRFLSGVLAPLGVWALTWKAGPQPFSTLAGAFLFMLAIGGLERLLRGVIELALVLWKPEQSKRES